MGLFLFLDELGAANFIFVAVNVEGRGGEVLQGTRFESDIVESQRVFAVEAVDNVFAVAFCIIERICAVIAP